MPGHLLKSNIGYVFAQANHVLELDLAARLKPIGLTVDQFRILWCLSERGSLPMGELAAIVLLEPANLTKVIDRMVSESLVMRVPDEKDRRRVLVTLAPRGRDLQSGFDAISKAHDAYARDMLNADYGADLSDLIGAAQTA